MNKNIKFNIIASIKSSKSRAESRPLGCIVETKQWQNKPKVFNNRNAYIQTNYLLLLADISQYRFRLARIKPSAKFYWNHCTSSVSLHISPTKTSRDTRQFKDLDNDSPAPSTVYPLTVQKAVLSEGAWWSLSFGQTGVHGNLPW